MRRWYKNFRTIFFPKATHDLGRRSITHIFLKATHAFLVWEICVKFLMKYKYP